MTYSIRATRDLNHIETFVPAAGEASGPPIVLAIIRFGRSLDNRTWRAGGLAGLLQRYLTSHVEDQIVRAVWISARINHELSIRRYG